MIHNKLLLYLSYIKFNRNTYKNYHIFINFILTIQQIKNLYAFVTLLNHKILIFKI